MLEGFRSDSLWLLPFWWRGRYFGCSGLINDAKMLLYGSMGLSQEICSEMGRWNSHEPRMPDLKNTLGAFHVSELFFIFGNEDRGSFGLLFPQVVFRSFKKNGEGTAIQTKAYELVSMWAKSKQLATIRDTDEENFKINFTSSSFNDSPGLEQPHGSIHWKPAQPGYNLRKTR